MSNYSESRYNEKDKNTSWKIVFDLIKPKSKVLDIGCSSGNFGEVLQKKKDCIVDGVELDKNDFIIAEKKLRKVYNINIETNDLNVIKDRYDYIYFGDVIEHLVDPVKTLRNIKLILKPKGMVVFSIPNMAHISVRLMLLKGRFEYGETGLLDKTHLHFYDIEEIGRIFNESGYEITTLDYVKRDIPKESLNYALKQIGLTADRKFINNTKKVEGSAYQFVGVASQSSKSNINKLKERLKLSPPIDEMEKHINYIKKVHKAQILDHKNRIHELESRLHLLESELSILNQETAIRAFIRKTFNKN